MNSCVCFLGRTGWLLRVGLGLALATCAALRAEPERPWQAPSGWTQTRGGDTGRTIAVTTLAARGPGSLAEAIATDGVRTIVFRVAGVIDLGGRSLSIRLPNVTIAGETAPSPGITVIQGGIGIATHDVILRHLRVRPGTPRGGARDFDGIATGRGAHDVIVDHCSISWATDENLSASGPRFSGDTPEEWRRGTSHRITFSHCIVAEGLNRSTHSKGVSHSKGSLIHDNADQIAVIGNLYISNAARNPLFKGGARGVIVNNLVHNAGGSAITYGLVPEQWEERPWVPGRIAIVGNVVRHGPNSGKDMPAIRFGSEWGVPACDVYVHDNRLLGRTGEPLPHVLSMISRPEVKRAAELRWLAEPPEWPAGLQARPSGEVVEWVLTNAGARPWDRDPVDRRLIAEARSGGGKIIDHEAEVGGLEAPPVAAPAKR